MSKKTKNLPKFDKFEEGTTDSYTPPEYLVQPAPNDTGFNMFKKAFDNQKKFFTPHIASTNHDLEENNDQISK